MEISISYIPLLTLNNIPTFIVGNAANSFLKMVFKVNGNSTFVKRTLGMGLWLWVHGLATSTD